MNKSQASYIMNHSRPYRFTRRFGWVVTMFLRLLAAIILPLMIVVACLGTAFTAIVERLRDDFAEVKWCGVFRIEKSDQETDNLIAEARQVLKGERWL